MVTKEVKILRNKSAMALIIECPCSPKDGPVGFMIVSEINNGRRISTKYRPYFHDNKYYSVGTKGVLKLYSGKGKAKGGSWHYEFTPKQVDKIKNKPNKPKIIYVRLVGRNDGPVWEGFPSKKKTIERASFLGKWIYKATLERIGRIGTDEKFHPVKRGMK